MHIDECLSIYIDLGRYFSKLVIKLCVKESNVSLDKLDCSPYRRGYKLEIRSR